jgi:hypothetical protein
MAELKHNGGIVEVMLELGFDAVKYFEGTITSTAQKISISPPARRLTLVNRDTTNPVYINITGDDAVAVATLIPGDNLKIAAGCEFEMDFDILESISLVTAAGITVEVEGYLGWKGTRGNC